MELPFQGEKKKQTVHHPQKKPHTRYSHSLFLSAPNTGNHESFSLTQTVNMLVLHYHMKGIDSMCFFVACISGLFLFIPSYSLV